MKTCLHCGAALTRKAYEKPHQFTKRATCGKSCARLLAPRPILSPKTRYRTVRVDGRRKQLSRHLVEARIGRPLKRSELVHHKNHDKLDDRLDNYEVTDAATHSRHHNQKHDPIKPCAICGSRFAPPLTHRGTTQTCGAKCKSALLSLRNKEMASA